VVILLKVPGTKNATARQDEGGLQSSNEQYRWPIVSDEIAAAVVAAMKLATAVVFVTVISPFLFLQRI
jgi:anti-sigma-K factor RskA